jgi:magnesium-transporting ATPase (P-type)
MDKFAALIEQTLNFRLWVDGASYFRYNTLDEKKVANFNDEIFKGGIQKIVLLSVLLFACSYTFWSAKGKNPEDIEKIFSATFQSTVVSGFAVYFLVSTLMYVWRQDVSLARFDANLLIIHVAVCLSLILIFNVSGWSVQIAEYFYGLEHRVL